MASETTATQPERFSDYGDAILLIRHILTSDLRERILQGLEGKPWVPSDVQARDPSQPRANTIADAGGALKAYGVINEDGELGNALWESLRGSIPERMVTGSVDDDNQIQWRPIGIHPSLRFVRFGPDSEGYTVPHYDVRQVSVHGNRRTLVSVVLALDLQPGDRLSARFLLDTQRWRPVEERNFTDHKEAAFHKRVLAEVSMSTSNCLVFDHRVLHDFAIRKAASGSDFILRADIIYERQGLQPRGSLPDEKTTEAEDDDEYLDDDEDDDDDFVEDYDVFDSKIWTSPLDKIQSRLATVGSDTSKELVVLVTTGALSPIHKGHVQMMEVAKRELEQRGKAVLGGFFCPDHGEYVHNKMVYNKQPNALSTAQRLHLCELAVADSDWLAVNRWTALHTPGAVDFPKIIEHVARMLAHHVRTHRPIKVVYVFGGDNASFCYYFVRRGAACVCVLRPGSQDRLETYSKYPGIRNSSRVLFSWDMTPALSSTDIRGGDTSGLADSVAKEWKRIQGGSLKRLALERRSVNFYIRDEGSWAVVPPAQTSQSAIDEAASVYANFCAGLHGAFVRAFDHSPKMLPSVNVVQLHLSNQGKMYRKLFNDHQVLSLDPCLPGTANVRVSQCFYPLSTQPQGFIACDEAPSIETQVNSIPPGHYVLFDDESFGRERIEHVANLLPAHCTVDKLKAFEDQSGLFSKGKQVALDKKALGQVNCRDFLAGSRESGICLKLFDGSVARAPCVLPYASPHGWCQVPVDAEREFSREVWKLNEEFYNSRSVQLRLRDMAPAFRELVDSLGYSLDMTMAEFCSSHVKQQSWYSHYTW